MISELNNGQADEADAIPCPLNVRFGSEADVGNVQNDVR